MKRISQYFKTFVLAMGLLSAASCVHDDKYEAPENGKNYQCQDLSADSNLRAISLADAKALYGGSAVYTFEENSNLYLEGYVSSSDETGNIYKTIYIQDLPENPTQGLAITVDATSTYTNFPQGSKIYVKLAGLSLGEYGGMIQVGKRLGTETRTTSVSRIAEKEVSKYVFRSCQEKVTIVPKVMTLADMRTANDQYLGTLIKVENAEFHQNVLCNQFAPDGQTVDRRITDPTNSATTRVVRNSGFASFASKTMPAGKGNLVGILSKFNSTYQIYIVRDSDLEMNTFPRNDGIAAAPCAVDATATATTVAKLKELSSTGTLTQITDNITLTAKVTANDETGNLFKYFYVEDATGGIRVNINMTSLYLDKRFQVGRQVAINLKDLYIGKVNGEYQLGGLYQGRLGQVETNQIFNHFFPTDFPITNVVPTEKTIASLTSEDVGKWIKIKDLQFADAELGKTLAEGTAMTNRTLTDCNGNTIIVRTSGRANFGNTATPMVANTVEVDTGKGDVYAILSEFNGTYQLWITKLRDIDLDNPRCDGTLPNKLNETTIFEEAFANLNNWTAVNVSGTETWNTANFGNPSPSAVMNGNRRANEDWLVKTAPVSLAGYTDANLSFETDGRYTGATLEVFVTENYTGTPATTTWTRLNPVLDADLNAFGGWTNSGKLNLKDFAGKNITIAFKYVSSAGASTTWEIDNVLIKGTK